VQMVGCYRSLLSLLRFRWLCDLKESHLRISASVKDLSTVFIFLLVNPTTLILILTRFHGYLRESGC
jgi:hypothetical protein